MVGDKSFICIKGYAKVRYEQQLPDKWTLSCFLVHWSGIWMVGLVHRTWHKDQPFEIQTTKSSVFRSTLYPHSKYMRVPSHQLRHWCRRVFQGEQTYNGLFIWGRGEQDQWPLKTDPEPWKDTHNLNFLYSGGVGAHPTVGQFQYFTSGFKLC